MLDLTPKLRPERAALLELLRGLAADDWDRPTECPAWDVKGLALHILGDDLSLLSRQRDVSTNGLLLYAVDHPGMSFRELLDGFNERWVTASTFLSRALVVELLGLVGEWSDAFYRDVGLDTISGEPVGLFAETQPSPYWQVIAREYLERFTHQSQIRRAVGAAELGGDLAVSVARVAVHLLAAWMRDYAPAAGASIAVELGGIGGWTWERTPEAWAVHEGAADGATARLAVPAPSSVALVSRGLSPPDVAAMMTISGDESVAGAVIDIVAPLLGRPAG